MRRTKSLPLVPIGLAFLAGLLALIPLAPMDDPAFSLLLGFRQPLASFNEPLIIDAPAGLALSPSRLAHILESLAEFDAGAAIIDVPVDWSTGDAASTRALGQLRSSVGSEFGLVTDNLRAFWQGLRGGSLRPADSGASFEALLAGVESARARLTELASPQSEELPSLVAALDLGRANWLALGLENARGPRDLTENPFLAGAAASLVEEGDLPRRYALPTLTGLARPPTVLAGAGAGSGWSLGGDGGMVEGRFPIVAAFQPLAAWEGQVVPNVALLALARRLGASRIVASREGLRLEGAWLPRQERRDLLIPLDSGGHALFDRERSGTAAARRIPLSEIEEGRSAETALVAAIEACEKAGYLVERAPPSLDWAKAAALERRLLGGAADGAGLSIQAWKEAKLAFFASTEASLAEKARIDAFCAGLLSTPGLADGARRGIENLRDSADRAFDAAADRLSRLLELRRRLGEELGASLVLLGREPVASATGLIQAEGSAPSDPSGRMASFLRAGLSGRFIGTVPRALVLGLCLGTALLVSLLALFLRPRQSLAAGALLATLLALGSGLLLSKAGLWISPLVPALVSLIPGLGASLGWKRDLPEGPEVTGEGGGPAAPGSIPQGGGPT